LRGAPDIRPAGAGGAATTTAPVERPGRRSRRQIEAPVAETPARVDPRFSARRIAVQRDAGRRRLRRVVWLGGLIAVLAGVVGLAWTPLLALHTIDVQGATGTLSPDQVRAVVVDAGLRPGTPLIKLDAGKAEAALEALPSVADAQVTRHWPSSVTIDVTERLPVAAVTVGSGTALVGADGTVVAVQPGPSDLVAVEGPNDLAVGDHLDEPGLLAVAAAMPDGVRQAIIGIQSTSDGVTLRLSADNAVVQLGAADQLAAKLAAVETMLAQVDTTCMAVLDVKVPSAPTITRRPGC
jgi:cell division protein FtsQ